MQYDYDKMQYDYELINSENYLRVTEFIITLQGCLQANLIPRTNLFELKRKK